MNDSKQYRILLWPTIVLAMMVIISIPVYADFASASGKCGNDASWKYDKKSETLTIYGSGPVADYDDLDNKAPWIKQGYQTQIRKIDIEPGITKIGDYAFDGFINVKDLIIPEETVSIGTQAFSDCNYLSVYYLGTKNGWNRINISEKNDALMNASFTFIGSTGTRFSDVSLNDYYADAVNWAVNKGVTNGTSISTFSPQNGCTRAQVVTFLWRAAGKPDIRYSTAFKDVDQNKYYAQAVAWAVDTGITNGTGNGKFDPDTTCTRGQIVTFLWRYKGAPNSSTISGFIDVAANKYYSAPVTWAIQNRITNGVGKGYFQPNSTCTRGQIVTFLYRAKDLK